MWRQANLTDVCAFIGTKFDDSSVKVLNVLVSVRPFSEPGDGAISDRFADDALYSIHIADPVTGATLRRYDFEFSEVSTTDSAGLKWAQDTRRKGYDPGTPQNLLTTRRSPGSPR